ncbi:MAG TPA: SDR family NAD(P)-dependent oxidoreductase [Bryobacteraceae bacterium]|nr:SDR family NAD(P)-dependent oxidoreductase [Bryobacteraceae bacterium]
MKKSLSSRLSSSALVSGAALAACAGAVVAARRMKSRAVAGKVVVITGGSRGLGLELAREFGRHGASLVLTARDDKELEEAKLRLLAEAVTKSAETVLTVVCDLTEPEDAQKLIEKTIQQFGRLDVLINNAGVIHVGPIEKQSLQMYRDAMNSNFFGMLHTTYAALPHLIKQGCGAVVNIASVGGKIPVPHLAPYVASKFAAVGFSETLHAELRSKGIRVTTVNPGLMRTGSFPNAIAVGQTEQEYSWFSLSASMPGLAHSVKYAARKIFRAVILGRAEIEVGMDAYLAARMHGLAPSGTAWLGSLAERVILPEASGSEVPAKGTELKPPRPALWKWWSSKLARRSNQPAAG